ncbi:MAG: hypothetical protein RR970_02355 [Hafnia sp.]
MNLTSKAKKKSTCLILAIFIFIGMYIYFQEDYKNEIIISSLFVLIVLFILAFGSNIMKIIKSEPNSKQADEAANKIQFSIQKIIFIALLSILTIKGIIEVLDSFSFFRSCTPVDHYMVHGGSSIRCENLVTGWSSSFIEHMKGIKTLQYVGSALAVSCGVQLAYMLITEGPDEAVEPIMLGVASTILLILSAISPESWNTTYVLVIAILILCIPILYFTSKKMKNDGKENEDKELFSDITEIEIKIAQLKGRLSTQRTQFKSSLDSLSSKTNKIHEDINNSIRLKNRAREKILGLSDSLRDLEDSINKSTHN